jgi:ABC-type multidrug transport system ATPase subunit
VEILEGFRPRSGGEVSVLGVDPARADGAWHNRVGTVLQESQPEPGLTVRECLQLYAGYYQAPREIDMDEAENLADRIAVIAAGRIVAEGTPQTLGGRERMAAKITFTLPIEVSAGDLPAELRRLPVPAADARVVLESTLPLVDVKLLAEWALERGLDLPDLDVRRPSLEDVYLRLTGGPEQRENG